MDKLIVTVTVDSTMSYPGNPHMPPIEDVEAVATQYIDAVAAGASIVHHHGVHYLEDKIQPDGRRLSKIDIDGWKNLTELIRAACDSVIQFGIASARLDEKIALMSLGPDMMSYAFNVHDEYFRPDEAYAANEMYALHPRDEIEEFCRAAQQHGVKTEAECFCTGAFWNVGYMRKAGVLDDPVWATLFLGWQGGAWTPPTHDGLRFLVDNRPPGLNYNVSVMDPMHWRIHALVIAMGGHVRVGWEDYPYLPNGELAKTNAELVDVIVRMAEAVGREVATPEEARRIIGLPSHDAVGATTGPAAKSRDVEVEA
jgi:3-keto-5-aminohexanoate cleavage enzyme